MNLLITGGGSVGRMLIEEFSDYIIRVIDHDDYCLWELQRAFPGLECVLLDVRHDMTEHIAWADVIIHTAAYKNIDITEANPSETVSNDVDSVYNIAKHGKHFILISTDKAVEPISVLGACKLLAEKITLKAGGSVVRFVNVEETRGNVFEVWRNSGEPYPITHADMKRHFVTTSQVKKLLRVVVNDATGGEIFIPKAPAINIMDKVGSIYGDVEVNIIGLRPNERIYDPLCLDSESPIFVDVE